MPRGRKSANQVNIEKENAQKDLDFLYKYDLKSGLKELINWRIKTGIDKK